jgi:hypothetical protein
LGTPLQYAGVLTQPAPTGEIPMEKQNMLELMAEEIGKEHAHFMLVIAMLIRAIAMQPNIDGSQLVSDVIDALTPSPEMDSWALKSMRELISSTSAA